MLLRKKFTAHYANGIKRVMKAVDISQAQYMARGVARKRGWRLITLTVGAA